MTNETKRSAFFSTEKGQKLLKGALAVVLALSAYFFMPTDEGTRRTAGIFTLAALFWALEIIPLYATSMLVIVLEIFLLAQPGGVLGMDRSGYKVFLAPFASPVIILFFGGFTLAHAVTKYGIDRLIARRLFARLGEHPFRVMIGLMGTTALLSMWMSNTATTAMMVAMIHPLLRQLDKGDPYRRALALSIPFAANIGGIGTPVGTPPNAIALGILTDQGIHVTFLSWMLMAVPLVVILLILTGVLLYRLFPPKQKRILLEVGDAGQLSKRSKGALAIAGLTILLWLTSGLTKIPSATVALLAATLFAVTGLLKRDDFKSLDWDILLLMWGGLALGKGLDVGGLAEWVVSLPILNQEGILLIILSCVLAVIMSTFISNTATANLLIPIVITIPGQDPLQLAVAVALSCSFAMALPVSTPPNAIAFATQTIEGKDMLRAGTLVSILSTVTLLAGFRFVMSLVF